MPPTTNFSGAAVSPEGLENVRPAPGWVPVPITSPVAAGYEPPVGQLFLPDGPISESELLPDRPTTTPPDQPSPAGPTTSQSPAAPLVRVESGPQKGPKSSDSLRSLLGSVTRQGSAALGSTPTGRSGWSGSVGSGRLRQRKSSSLVNVSLPNTPLPGKTKSKFGNEAQAKLLAQEGTIWNAVVFSNEQTAFEEFKAMVDNDMAKVDGVLDTDTGEWETPPCQFVRDPNGGTVLHVALLVKKYKFASYLIDKYGADLVKLGFGFHTGWQRNPVGNYTGETILHIAIVNCSYSEIKNLTPEQRQTRFSMITRILEICPHLIDEPTCGTFFSQQNSKCYYGDVPFLFAVSTGSITTVKELIKHNKHGKGIIPRAKDSLGNTALHMAVYHSHTKMFSYLSRILSEMAEDCPDPDGKKAYLTRLTQPHNSSDLTPLGYAVSMCNDVMFAAICQEKQSVMWAFGPVTCFMMPLAEFDTVGKGGQTFARYSALGIAALLGHDHILEHEFIQEMLDEKWSLFARGQWYAGQVLFTVLMVLLLVLVSQLREGGSIFTKAKVPCRLIFGYSNDRAGNIFDNDDNMLTEATAIATGCVMEPNAYPTQHTTERVVLEWLVAGITSMFALLELYDDYNWLKREWLYFSQQIQCVVGQPQIKRLWSTASDERPAQVDLEALASRSKLRQLWTFLGFVLLEVLHAIFGRSILFTKALRRLKHGCPLGRQELDLAPSYVLWVFIVVIFLHFGFFLHEAFPRDERTQHRELALASIFGSVYFLLFARAQKNLGFLVISLGKIITKDIVRYITLYFVVLLAFAQAFYLILTEEEIGEDGEVKCEFCSIWTSFMTVFRSSLGEFNFTYFRHHEAGLLLYILYFSFALLANILLVNLLIAMMNSTYNEVAADAEAVWLRQHARFILQAEMRLSNRLRDRYRLGRDRGSNPADDTDNMEFQYVYEAVSAIEVCEDDDEMADKIRSAGKFNLREVLRQQRNTMKIK